MANSSKTPFPLYIVNEMKDSKGQPLLNDQGEPRSRWTEVGVVFMHGDMEGGAIRLHDGISISGDNITFRRRKQTDEPGEQKA